MIRLNYFLLILLLGYACSRSAETTYIDLTENALSVKSSGFTMHSEEEEIFVECYKTYYFTHIELISTVALTLKSSELINSFEISPASHEIEGSLDENGLHFTIDRPGYVMLRINEDQRIFIFADKPEIPPEAERISILDYGVNRTGNSYSTIALQKALDEISGSGKVLEFPEGIYKTGVLSIKSNSRIHLDAGAVILGPDNPSELKPEEFTGPMRFIMIKDAENVHISGRGIIDANGRYLRDHFQDEGRCRALLVLNSKNITVDGIILRNSGSWNTQILYSEDVILKNIKMLNDIEISNTDGFDPDASKRVLIEDCFAYCGDDNVAIKSTGTAGYLQDVEDITVRGCVFLTKKSALKVGTESKAESMKNILFENNDVLECDRGMTLYCYDGAGYENIRYINNRFEHNFPDRNQCGIHFRLKKREKDSRIGAMSQILIKDCSFKTAFPNPMLIDGFDRDHQIELRIENLSIRGETITPENDARFILGNLVDITYK